MSELFVGVDISSRWFDVCILVGEKRYPRQFANAGNGFAECLRWLRTFGEEFMIGFEPTGRYSEALADYMCKQSGISIHQVEVRRFKQFAQSLDPHSKTDAGDAFALAVFVRERNQVLRKYRQPSELRRELRDLQMRMRSLVKRTSALKSQMKCRLYSELVIASIRAEIAMQEREYEAVFDEIRKLILCDDDLAQDKRLLESIPGIGETTAVLMLSLIDFRQFKNSRSLARFLGLTQMQKESGISVKGGRRITKAGNADVRAALFFPAMSAIRHNACLKTFANRLLGQGKPFALVRTAVARKLITYAWAVIHQKCRFDVNHEVLRTS